MSSRYRRTSRQLGFAAFDFMSRIKKWELYDLAQNRFETADLAKKHPEEVKAWSEAWFAWAKKTGVRVKK